MDVFEAFPEAIQPITFLELNEGGILGNTIKSTHTFNGILKERKGMTQNQNMELKESTSTLHIPPQEAFIASVGGELVGHGIRATKNGSTVEYRIVGQREGYDFDLGQLMFYRIELKKESLAEYTDGS